MNTAGLSFARIPALSVPLRFYLTAPCFGVLAAVLVASGGAEAWSSRWTPPMLAATHLLTLGFVAMVMLGSLFQLLPVVAGVPIPATWPVAPLVHLLLGSGALGIAAGLQWHHQGLLSLGAALAALAFGTFLLPLGLQLARRIGGGATVFAIRLAAFSLLVTLGVGLYLVLGYLVPSSGVGRHTVWTDVHAGWGVAGWVTLLVMGVSYQVIPMFHVAPEHPPWLARGAVLVAFGGLGAASVVALAGTDTVVALAVPSAALLVYALATLRQLARRRRRRAEPLIQSWRLALVCLVAAVVYNLGRALAPAIDLPHGRGALLVGVLLVAGFGLTVIEGMLQKIVPFLAFLHLQRACLQDPAAMLALPSMADFVPDSRAWLQLLLHGLALALLIGAVGWPPMGPGAAVVFGLDFAWLGATLVVASRRYLRAAAAMAAHVP